MLIVRPKIPQMSQNLSAQFVYPNFNKKGFIGRPKSVAMPQFFHRMKYLYFLYIIRNFHSLTRISVHCDIQKPFICMYFNCTKAIHFRHFPTEFRLEIPQSSTFIDRKRWYFPVDEIVDKMSSELFKNYCCKKSDDPISFPVEKVVYFTFGIVTF